MKSLSLFVRSLLLLVVVQAELRVPPVPFQEFDEDFLMLSMQAAEISLALKERNTQSFFPEASVFVDEPDKSLVVKIDDICFAAFRETLFRSPVDAVQNLKPGFEAVCSSSDPSNCCQVREGYREVVFEVRFFDEFEAALRDCSASCDGTQCEVVLTGFSQGGAAAQVASIPFEDLSPTVITFGQPYTIGLPCNIINEDKYYRFVNTENQGTKLEYDPVPFIAVAGTNQTGRVFVLSESSNGVPSYPTREDPTPRGVDFAPGWILVHDLESYYSRLVRLEAEASLPLSLDGFDTGKPCTLDEQCAPPDNCSQRVCASSPVDSFIPAGGGGQGASCGSDRDCRMGFRCQGLIAPECVRSFGPRGEPSSRDSSLTAAMISLMVALFNAILDMVK